MPPDLEPTVPADDMEVLNAEDEQVVTEEKEEEEEELEEKEEVEEEKEEEEEDKDEEEEGKDKEEKEEKEEEEDLGPRRPSLRDIKAKYPEFFKDFPGLRDAFFRESEYSKIFPTIDDAKDAAKENETLSGMRDKVISGDISVILDSVKAADSRSYTKLLDNILPTLYKSNQQDYLRVITPSIENLVRIAYRDGKTGDDEELQNAALNLSKWFFNTEDVALGKTTTVKKADAPSPEEQKLNKERDDYEAGKFRDAYGRVLEDRDTILNESISKGLDPDNEMTPYMKKKLVADIIAEVDDALKSDKDHMALMNAKWRRAKEEGYSRDSLQRIVSAYQARAKSLIPSVRSRLRAEALGISPKKAKKAEEITERKEVPAGRSARSGGEMPHPSKIDWRHTTDADILAGDVKTK